MKKHIFNDSSHKCHPKRTYCPPPTYPQHKKLKIKSNISLYLQISRTLKISPSFIQLDPNTRNLLGNGSPSRLGHVTSNVNFTFFSNSPELPSPILALSTQSPPAPQFPNQRPNSNHQKSSMLNDSLSPAVCSSSPPHQIPPKSQAERQPGPKP